MITFLASALLSLSTLRPIDTCKIGKDSLTGRTIYLTTEIEPRCEGGKQQLMRQMNNLEYYDSALTNEIETHFVVGFIIETDGRISGERVILDNTHKMGTQILKILKGLRWFPGECNGKKVATLYKVPINIELRGAD
jgi:hypothetical protein